MKNFSDDIALLNSFPLRFACPEKRKPKVVSDRSFIVVEKENSKIEDVKDTQVDSGLRWSSIPNQKRK